MVVNMEIGMITPPVGLNLFVTAGITGMSVMQVVRAALPWLGILFLLLILITYVPALSTWLPYSLMGPERVGYGAPQPAETWTRGSGRGSSLPAHVPRYGDATPSHNR